MYLVKKPRFPLYPKGVVRGSFYRYRFSAFHFYSKEPVEDLPELLMAAPIWDSHQGLEPGLILSPAHEDDGAALVAVQHAPYSTPANRVALHVQTRENCVLVIHGDHPEAQIVSAPRALTDHAVSRFKERAGFPGSFTAARAYLQERLGFARLADRRTHARMRPAPPAHYVWLLNSYQHELALFASESGDVLTVLARPSQVEVAA